MKIPETRTMTCAECGQTVIRAYESGYAPQYDCYFDTTCWKGHRHTFERD